MGLFSREVIGIDISKTSVKVVGAIMNRRHPLVTAFAEAPLDKQYIAKNGLAEPKAIADALKEAMRSGFPKPIHASEAYASISEGMVFRKILEVPITVSAEELPSVVRAEAVEYLPDKIENLEVDYQSLGRLPGDLQQIMVVAVAKPVIDTYLAAAELAHLKLRGLDPTPSAVGRAIVTPKEKDPIILVDIGAVMTSISIYAEHMVWVTGTVNMGADAIRDQVTGEYDEKKDAKIERLVDAIADEISHVLKFYQNRANQEQEIKEVRLAGGGALLEGVVEALQKQSKPKVSIGSPVLPFPKEGNIRFCNALGSALYPFYES